MAADSPVAPSPSSASSAGCISPVEIPFRYSQGMNSSTFFVRFKYGGTAVELSVSDLWLDRNLTHLDTCADSTR